MASTALTYEAAIARLGRALTFGINPSLDGIRALTEALGRPQDGIRFVQVTGTNGKTSVVRMTSAILTIAGRRTGMYTSPHLSSYTERFAVDGVAVSESDLAAVLALVFAAADGLACQFTEFELLTAAALVLFREQGVEWAVLEVGMGGKWDATSVVVPEVAVITGVGLDHTERLGPTREAIAEDKSHIIKERSRVVIGPGCHGVLGIIEKRAAEMGSPLVGYIGVGDDPDVTYRIARRPRRLKGALILDVDVKAACGYRVALHVPAYQAPNVATAMAAAGAALLEVGPAHLAQAALESVTFPGRFEVLRRNPVLIVDGAHNPEAAGVLAGAIEEAFGDQAPVVVLGILADKDAEGIVRALAPVAATFVATQSHSARALAAEELAQVIESVTGVRPTVEPDLARAIDAAGVDGRGVVVTGSLYTVGEARELLAR